MTKQRLIDYGCVFGMLSLALWGWSIFNGSGVGYFDPTAHYTILYWSDFWHFCWRAFKGSFVICTAVALFVKFDQAGRLESRVYALEFDLKKLWSGERYTLVNGEMYLRVDPRENYWYRGGP